MNVYVATYSDGYRTTVRATSTADARACAYRAYRYPVLSITLARI